MTKLAKSVAIAYVVGPALQFGRVDFDGPSARATDQMVVVLIDHASSVEGFASFGHHDVDVAAGHQLLQLGVDRRERDRGAVAQNEGVQFLGTDEALDARQHAEDLAALDR